MDVRRRFHEQVKGSCGGGRIPGWLRPGDHIIGAPSPLFHEITLRCGLSLGHPLSSTSAMARPSRAQCEDAMRRAKGFGPGPCHRTPAGRTPSERLQYGRFSCAPRFVAYPEPEACIIDDSNGIARVSSGSMNRTDSLERDIIPPATGAR